MFLALPTQVGFCVVDDTACWAVGHLHEYGAQVWAEMADGSCRWRQTGSEVKVIALRVPPDVPPADVVVDFDPYHLRGMPASEASYAKPQSLSPTTEADCCGSFHQIQRLARQHGLAFVRSRS